MCILPNEFELVADADDADDAWGLEDIDLNWDSPRSAREARAISRPSTNSNVRDGSTETTGRSVNWDRIDEIEKRRQSQPLYGVDHRELARHEQVLQFPDTHPSLERRREQLQAIQRALEE